MKKSDLFLALVFGLIGFSGVGAFNYFDSSGSKGTLYTSLLDVEDVLDKQETARKATEDSDIKVQRSLENNEDLDQKLRQALEVGSEDSVPENDVTGYNIVGTPRPVARNKNDKELLKYGVRLEFLERYPKSGKFFIDENLAIKTRFELLNTALTDDFSLAYGASNEGVKCVFIDEDDRKINQELKIAGGKSVKIDLNCGVGKITKAEIVTLKITAFGKKGKLVNELERKLELVVAEAIALDQPFNLEIVGKNQTFVDSDIMVFAANFPIVGAELPRDVLVKIQVSDTADFAKIVSEKIYNGQLERNNQLLKFEEKVRNIGLKDGIYYLRAKFRIDDLESGFGVSEERFKLANGTEKYCRLASEIACFNQDGSHECVEAGDKLACPAGLSLCNPEDNWCREVGESGESELDWCVNGIKNLDKKGLMSCEPSVSYFGDLNLQAGHDNKIEEYLKYYDWLIAKYQKDLDDAEKLAELLEKDMYLLQFYPRAEKSIGARALLEIEADLATLETRFDDLRIENADEVKKILEDFLYLALAEFELVMAENVADFREERKLIEEFSNLLNDNFDADKALKLFDLFEQIGGKLAGYGFAIDSKIDLQQFAFSKLLNDELFSEIDSQLVMLIDTEVNALVDKIEYLENFVRLKSYRGLLRILVNLLKEKLEMRFEISNERDERIDNVLTVRNLYLDSTLSIDNQRELKEINEAILSEDTCSSGAIRSFLESLIVALSKDALDADGVIEFKKQFTSVCK